MIKNVQTLTRYTKLFFLLTYWKCKHFIYYLFTLLHVLPIVFIFWVYYEAWAWLAVYDEEMCDEDYHRRVSVLFRLSLLKSTAGKLLVHINVEEYWSLFHNQRNTFDLFLHRPPQRLSHHMISHAYQFIYETLFAWLIFFNVVFKVVKLNKVK